MKKLSIFYFLFLSAVIFICSSCNDKNEKECCKKKDSEIKTAVISPTDKSEESVYQLEGKWVNQNNNPVKLIDLEGKVQIAAMVFTNCASACPRIVEDMQLIESKLTLVQKGKVEFLLISFDNERDTPERLTLFAKEKQLTKKWTLLHGEEDSVRELALVLGVKYEKQDDGSFAHSNIITTLDPTGAIAFQQEGLGESPDKTVEKINDLLK